MKSGEISQFIMDTIEDLVYVADVSTYALYYLNAAAMQGLGLDTEEEWYQKKCYKVLQGLDAPCPFCTNCHIQHDKFYNWEHYNPIIGKHFYIQDKQISYKGVEARLEIAKDITEVKLLEQQVAQKYNEQRVLNQCVGTLHSTRTPDESINELLQIIADFYSAERGYIFALSDDKAFVDNTYEWCHEGVEPQIDNLQRVDASLVARWFEKYETVGEFYIDVLDEDVVVGSQEYEILKDQGITSLVTAPIRDKDGAIIGFIGVDNPKENIKEMTVIKAVTTFVADFFDKNELIDKLNRLSYYDSLTGLKNRHSYSLALGALQRGEKTTLGVVYVDVNGLKYINDKLGHQIGDKCITTVAHTVRAMFTGMTYRIGGDEFVALCTGIAQDAFMQRVAELETRLQVDELSKASIGYVWQEDSRDVIRQIEQADTSMYRAKQRYYSTSPAKDGIAEAKKHVDNIKKAIAEASGVENWAKG